MLGQPCGTPGVTGFVGNAYDPVPLSQQEVFDMLAPSLLQEAAKEAEKAGAPLTGEAAEEVAPGFRGLRSW